METYLKRTYVRQKQRKEREKQDESEEFPFWDYRSRRGSLSTSASGNSTTSSSGSSSFDGCSLSSLSSIRSADTLSLISSSMSSSDTDSIMVTSDPYRLQLQFMVDNHEVSSLTDLYQSAVDWVDQDLRVLKVSEKTDPGNVNQSFNQPKLVSRMPSIAIMLFLSEDGPLGYERIQAAKRKFEKTPWKFHHSEHVSHGKINPYPYNSPDYFYTSEELPLWAIRMVHCGKEFLRIVLFTSQESWDDMIVFYKLIIGFEADICKDDFCLFTIHTHGHYDVQFALKKLKGETTPRHLESVKIQFRVPDVGSLVPLFPNVCKPISDNLWETQDHDGNTITIDVTGKPRPKSSTPSHGKSTASNSSRVSSRSSASSASYGSRASSRSTKSEQSVASLTSVTSSSMTTSITSVSSDQSMSVSESSTVSTQVDNADKPPKLPPRVPLKKGRLKPPKLPEKPTQCLAAMQGFYV